MGSRTPSKWFAETTGRRCSYPGVLVRRRRERQRGVRSPRLDRRGPPERRRGHHAGELVRKQLLSAVRNEDLGLVVDLSGARYIDSVGVSLLFELAERLAARQLRLAVVMPPDGLVERVLTIVNLNSVAEVHPGLDEALAALQSP